MAATLISVERMFNTESMTALMIVVVTEKLLSCLVDVDAKLYGVRSHTCITTFTCMRRR